MKRKLFFLSFWIVGILFPFGTLTLLSRTYAAWFNWIFDAEAMHVIMHASLFGVLAVSLAVTFAPATPPSVTLRLAQRVSVQLMFIWLIVAIVATLQELIQLAYKAHAWSLAETYDIGTDLMGAALGLVVVWSVGQIRNG
jgi:hypothetical protein